MEDLFQGQGLEGSKADRQNLSDATETLGSRELEVKLQLEDFRQRQWKHLEAG